MHVPVMAREAVEMLALRGSGIYVDGTLGAGGHARALLESLGGKGTLVGIDRDESALANARRTLLPWADQCRLVHGNFSDIRLLLEKIGIKRVDGILLDLGMSSMQVDEAGRGFSFMREGPLDMRMDRSRGQTAEELIGRMSEAELGRVIGEYGEEPASRRIARAIVIERANKGFWTTSRLARTVESVLPRRGRIHPATRTFQALRIAVNDELGALAGTLEEGIALLSPGGRMVVISYHSLEDRLVKQSFRKHVGRWESLPEGGRRWEGTQPVAKAVVKKPLRASAAEVATNPRARSAKMRCIERIG